MTTRANIRVLDASLVARLFELVVAAVEKVWDDQRRDSPHRGWNCQEEQGQNVKSTEFNTLTGDGG